MAARGTWQYDILSGLGARLTPENVRFVNAWQRTEGGTAAYNPFNTTLRRPGATRYNPTGVQNYRGYRQGIDATLSTMREGRYRPLVQALRGGRMNASQLAGILGRTPWGTDQALLAKVLAGGVSASYQRPRYVYHGGAWHR